ncbi:unnamed protein product [Candida verbasci]|uniref:Fe2OG dioxygenase domain-containing protein n=1 Tax=Candida verbasci TaxID=1227364 RepID=A0A9W4TWB4_9ASCO|nr:unnamed protein product [Candida verbasci]
MATVTTTATTTTSSFQDVLNDNIHKRIPLSTYETTLLSSYNQIQEIDIPEFDPYLHLNYYQNDLNKHKFQDTRRVTMEELGLTHPDQISKIGVTDPFELFTLEAIAIMRKEILNKETFMRFARYNFNSTSGMDCCIRGYVKNDDEISCPFIYQAWTNPKTMELLSKIAGVELKIIMDYEIGHVNISMKGKDEESQDTKIIDAVVDWHYDSYPFVCVLMLSDTSNMVGGETCLKISNDEVVKIPGPKMGSASMLQGRLINHIAPVPKGMSERITMVTSFTAKHPLIKDTSNLKTVKPEINFGTRYNDFYSQWINYRIDLISQQLTLVKQNCKDKDGNFQKLSTIEALKQIESYLKLTYSEMGFTKEEIDLINK